MRFAPQFLDEIRARVSVSDVVGRRVTWDRRKSQPAKGDYWACCPFHNEKTPSFHADNRRGIYHCFGCHASGDIFTFLVEKEGLNFAEAVEQLAGLAGLPMPAPDPRAEERAAARRTLHDVMELAIRFFERALQAREGAVARGYLADRGVDPAAVSRFRLGYAPVGRHVLKEHLAAEGVSAQDMVAAGLVIAGPDIPVSYDRFRDRIMFPIADLRGAPVGFGGRAMAADAQAKYLNSPETELFHKGSLLYNAAAARQAAREAATVIAVEGYMDVIALAQAGIDHAVAPLGTAMTADQLALLWRMGDEPILCFDGDMAGQKAAMRAADLAMPLLKPGKSLRFAMLPEGQDPDDLIRQSGRAGIDAVLAGALPLVDMIWQREKEQGDWTTPERRAAFQARLADMVRQIGDETVRAQYAGEFRARVATAWGTAIQKGPAAANRRPGRSAGRGRQAFRQPGGPSQSLLRNAAARGAAAPFPRREALLLVGVINHPRLLDEHFEDFHALDLTNQRLDRLRGTILDLVAGYDNEIPGNLAELLVEEGHQELLQRLAEIVRREAAGFLVPDAQYIDAERGWRHIMALHRKAVTLHRELKAAELACAQDDSEANYARLLDIQRQLASAEGTEALLEGIKD